MDSSNFSLTPLPTSEGTQAQRAQAQRENVKNQMALQREQDIAQAAKLILEQFTKAPADPADAIDAIICQNRGDARRKMWLSIAPTTRAPKILTYVWPTDSEFAFYGKWECREGLQQPRYQASLHPMHHLSPSPEDLRRLEQFEEAPHEMDLVPPSPEILRTLGLPEEVLGKILREVPANAMCKDYDQARARRNKEMTKQTYIWPSDTHEGMINVMQYHSKTPQTFSAGALSRVIKNFTWIEPKPQKQSAKFEGTESKLKKGLKKLGIPEDTLGKIPERALCESADEIWKHMQVDDIRKTYLWFDMWLGSKGSIKIKQCDDKYSAHPPEALAAAIKDITWVAPETETTKALTRVGVPRRCICNHFEDAQRRRGTGSMFASSLEPRERSYLTYIWLNERTGGFDVWGPLTAKGKKRE